MFDSNVNFAMSHEKLNNYTVASHFHKCYELVYYIRGTGVSTIDGKDYFYSDHSFCIIPPNTLHSEYSKTETDLMYIGFFYDDSLGKLPVTMIRASEAHPVFHSMNGILQEMSNRDANYAIMLTLHLSMLIIESLRITQINLTEDNEVQLQMDYMKNYIKDNYNKNFKPEDLASSIGYSYHYFRHLFKEQYGITIKQYVLELRIKHAKKLLQESSLPIAQIATESGFSSPARFITMFKQHVGDSPLVYRKKLASYAEEATYPDEEL